MGQIFPWQDPRDAAEGRVQPVKERLRARQSISGLHLHNKWSSRGSSSARTRTHTRRSSTPQNTPTRGHRRGEGRRKRGDGGSLSAGVALPGRSSPGSHVQTVGLHSCDATNSSVSANLQQRLRKRSPVIEKVNHEPERLLR